MVEIYIVPFSNRGDDTEGPISVTHRSNGLQETLDPDTPVRLGLPRNIFHELLSDIDNLQCNVLKINENINCKTSFGYPQAILAF
jgi:hypothetical protein